MANGYICFYSGKKVEVEADTSYAAQTKATAEFQKMFPRKKVKSYDVTVKLAEKDGEQVTTHSESIELDEEFYRGWDIVYNANAPKSGQWKATWHGVSINNNSKESVKRMIDIKFKEKNDKKESNLESCLTILEGGIPNSSGIRDALDKVITGDAELTDKERLVLLKYKLIGDNGKPTQLAKEEFSELFENLNEGYHYIIGMKKGKKRYINSKGKWDGENATLKKFNSSASAKAFVDDGYLNQDGMDEILVQFKG